VGLYEVRAGPGIEAKTGDMSWIKQVDCAEAAAQALTTPEQSAISQINRCACQPAPARRERSRPGVARSRG
jgi:hypothetical protein